MASDDSTSFGGAQASEQALLAEYDALRAEVLQRTDAQSRVIWLTIAALGALLTVAFQSKELALSFLYPLLAIFLAASWAHDDYRTRQKAIYIRLRIEERLGYDPEQRL